MNRIAFRELLGTETKLMLREPALLFWAVAFPLVLKSARAAFESVDPQLERAARTLGVSETAIFFRVTLPLAMRGILAGTSADPNVLRLLPAYILNEGHVDILRDALSKISA